MRIAVVDSGADKRMYPSVSTGYCFAPSEGITYHDDNGHGSHCISTILHYNPQAEIIPIKVLDSELRTSSICLAKALEFLYKMNVDLIHLSLSFQHEDYTLYRIIEGLVASGKIVIASYSNKCGVHSYPAEYSFVYGVIGGFFSDERRFLHEQACSKITCSKVPILVKKGNGERVFFSGNSKAAAVFTGIISKYLMEYRHQGINELIMMNASKGREFILDNNDLFLAQDETLDNKEDEQLAQIIRSVYRRKSIDIDLYWPASNLFVLPNYFQLLPNIIAEIEVQYGVEIPLFTSVLEFRTKSSLYKMIQKIKLEAI